MNLTNSFPAKTVASFPRFGSGVWGGNSAQKLFFQDKNSTPTSSSNKTDTLQLSKSDKKPDTFGFVVNTDWYMKDINEIKKGAENIKKIINTKPLDILKRDKDSQELRRKVAKLRQYIPGKDILARIDYHMYLADTYPDIRDSELRIINRKEALKLAEKLESTSSVKAEKMRWIQDNLALAYFDQVDTNKGSTNQKRVSVFEAFEIIEPLLKWQHLSPHLYANTRKKMVHLSIQCAKNVLLKAQNQQINNNKRNADIEQRKLQEAKQHCETVLTGELKTYASFSQKESANHNLEAINKLLEKYSLNKK